LEEKLRRIRLARMPRLVAATGLAVALTGSLLTGPATPALAADGDDIGILATCVDSRSAGTGSSIISNRLSGVTSHVMKGSIAGGTYYWGRVTGTSTNLGNINWVIFEVDTNNNNVANCFLRRSVGSSATNTAAVQKGSSSWRFRTCWAVTNLTSCAGLNSRTAWTSG
jgi:hypothetical protein